MASKHAGYPVCTGAQRTLRFVSLVYLAWYVLIAAAGLLSVCAYVLLGVDASAWTGAAAPTRAAALANGIRFALDVAFNLCVSISAWMASNHPAIAPRFRVFAGVLVALSLASMGYAVFFAQLAGFITSLYSLFITGLLLYLSNQIVRERAEGFAIDICDLATGAGGKRLRTERQVMRAIEAGELPAPPADAPESPES